MFGRNAVFKIDQKREKLLVRDVFHTVQGEGPRSGQNALFIRLGGCPLRCSFCDTDFDEQASTWMTHGELVLHVYDWYADEKGHFVPMLGSIHPGRWPGLVVTGGEPLAQNIRALLVWGLRTFSWVQVETSGVAPLPEPWPTGVELICSPKVATVHPSVLDRCRYWKYVVRTKDQEDEHGIPRYTGHSVVGVATTLPKPHYPDAEIWLQPVEEYSADGTPDEAATHANARKAAELCQRFGYNLSLQGHKRVGLP